MALRKNLVANAGAALLSAEKPRIPKQLTLGVAVGPPRSSNSKTRRSARVQRQGVSASRRCLKHTRGGARKNIARDAAAAQQQRRTCQQRRACVRRLSPAADVLYARRRGRPPPLCFVIHNTRAQGWRRRERRERERERNTTTRPERSVSATLSAAASLPGTQKAPRIGPDHLLLDIVCMCVLVVRLLADQAKRLAVAATAITPNDTCAAPMACASASPPPPAPALHSPCHLI